jgi:hypothetical protein
MQLQANNILKSNCYLTLKHPKLKGGGRWEACLEL